MPPYREQVRWPLWTAFPLGAVLFIGGRGAWGLHSKGGWDWPLVGLLAILATILAAAWLFRCLVIELGPEGVFYGFGRPRNRVLRDQIESVAVEDYDWARYMGWGWRIGPRRRERAFAVLGHPRGVRLVFRDEHDLVWSIFLSCSDPARALDAFQGKKT